jgi:hypothetical protein
MGQTWLNRRIKGPSAVGGEGDPVKKKKGGVKPYVTYDRDDPRIQAHSDSLDAHLLTKYFEEELLPKTSIVPANTPSLTTTGHVYDYYASKTKMKPSRIVSSNHETKREFPLYDKPKQKVILQSLEKMPIRKLKSESTSNEVPELNHPQWYRMKDKKVMGTNGKWESAYQYKTRKGLSNKQMYRSFPGLKPDK